MSQSSKAKTMKVKPDTHQELTLFKQYINGLVDRPFTALSFDDMIRWMVGNNTHSDGYLKWRRELNDVRSKTTKVGAAD